MSSFEVSRLSPVLESFGVPHPSRRSKHSSPHILVFLLVLATIGCTPGRSTSKKVELSVFAASSLTEPFQDLEREFESKHPTVDVKLIFAGSQVLRLQIEQGARADVFASANDTHMNALIDSRHIEESSVFARNELVVIVPRSNPARIDSFSDLTKAVRLVIGADNVPIGIYTRRVLTRARTALGGAFVDEVQQRVASEESNVRLVRTKVEMGEADAAIVYRTDAVSSDQVRIVPIPTEFNVRASYSIGTAFRTPRKAAADQFVTYVLSSPGQQILRRHGFVTEGM